MAEMYVGTKHGEFGLEDWQSLVGRFPKYADRAIASAVKSEAYRMQKMIKMSMMFQSLAGLGLAPLHPHTYAIRAWKRREKARAVKIAKGVRVRNRKKFPKHIESLSGQKPLQRLAGSIRYTYDDSIKTATVGPLDVKWRGLMKKHAEGFSTHVDSRMRKMMFAAGFPLAKGTTTLKVPPRPIISRIFEKEKAVMIKNVAERAMRNIYRYLTGKGKEQVEKEWVI